MRDAPAVAWQEELFGLLKEAGVRQVAWVPDAGHAHVIDRVLADPEMLGIPLTTEEEGVALSSGAWLGGDRAVLLMQSSGVGNCVNMLSLVSTCRFPFLALVTMRGEWEERNEWQRRQSPSARSSSRCATPECQRARGRFVFSVSHSKREVSASRRSSESRGFPKSGFGTSRSILTEASLARSYSAMGVSSGLGSWRRQRTSSRRFTPSQSPPASLPGRSRLRLRVLYVARSWRGCKPR